MKTRPRQNPLTSTDVSVTNIPRPLLYFEETRKERALTYGFTETFHEKRCLLSEGFVGVREDVKRILTELV